MYEIKQSVAITIPFFAHDANGDAITGLTDGSFTKRISKGSGAFAAMTVTITEMENGWYSFPLSTTHSNTLGLLTLVFTNAGAKQVNLQWRVEAKLIDDLNDVAATDIVSSGAITTLSGAVVLVNTTTTNTDMRGTNGANTLAPDNAGIAAIEVDTGTSIPAQIAALNNLTAAEVLAAGDIDGLSLENSQKIILAGAGGKVSGAATTTMLIRAADDSKTRITATVDADGNRSAVTLDATG